MNFADGDWKPQRITRAVGVTALQVSLPANLRRRKPAAQHLIYMDENCCAVKHAPPMRSRSGSGTDKRTAYRASARGIAGRGIMEAFTLSRSLHALSRISADAAVVSADSAADSGAEFVGISSVTSSQRSCAYTSTFRNLPETVR